MCRKTIWHSFPPCRWRPDVQSSQTSVKITLVTTHTHCSNSPGSLLPPSSCYVRQESRCLSGLLHKCEACRRSGVQEHLLCGNDPDEQAPCHPRACGEGGVACDGARGLHVPDEGKRGGDGVEGQVGQSPDLQCLPCDWWCVRPEETEERWCCETGALSPSPTWIQQVYGWRWPERPEKKLLCHQ